MAWGARLEVALRRRHVIRDAVRVGVGLGVDAVTRRAIASSTVTRSGPRAALASSACRRAA